MILYYLCKRVKKINGGNGEVTTYYTGYCLTGDKNIAYLFSSKKEAYDMRDHLAKNAYNAFGKMIVKSKVV